MYRPTKPTVPEGQGVYFHAQNFIASTTKIVSSLLHVHMSCGVFWPGTTGKGDP